MKTILVPTDFSDAANNAAYYAWHLASGMGANLKLCHAITVPTETPMAAQVAWPLEDYTSLKTEATAELFSLADKLAGQGLAANTTPYTHVPAIDCVSDLGSVADISRNLVDEHDMNLVVMGMSGAGALSRFFLGSNSLDMIEKATFPLLLIPAATTFKGINKIGFATDLRKSDIEIINKLSGLARVFDAEILISHVNDDKVDGDEDQDRVDAFLNDITGKINYPKIYYRHVKSINIDHGLEWLTENALVDVLAMVHHPHNLLASIFEGSHTKKMARNIEIPLLVFPPKCNTAAL